LQSSILKEETLYFSLSQVQVTDFQKTSQQSFKISEQYLAKLHGKDN